MISSTFELAKEIEHDKVNSCFSINDDNQFFVAGKEEIEQRVGTIMSIGEELYNKLSKLEEKEKTTLLAVEKFDEYLTKDDIKYNKKLSYTENTDVVTQESINRACAFGLIAGITKARAEDLESEGK